MCSDTKLEYWMKYMKISVISGIISLLAVLATIINGYITPFFILGFGIFISSIIASYSIWMHKQIRKDPSSTSGSWIQLILIWIYTYFSIFTYPIIYWLKNKSQTRGDVAPNNINASQSQKNSSEEKRHNKTVNDRKRIQYYAYKKEDHAKIDDSNYAVSADEQGIAFGRSGYDIQYKDITDASDYQLTTTYHTYLKHKNPSLWQFGQERGFDEPDEVLRRNGLELIKKDGSHILIYTENRGENDGPEFPEGLFEKISNHSEKFADPEFEYILHNPFRYGAKLKVEGWSDGASQIDANIDAQSETSGRSKGIEIGPFIQSSTSSASSIDGKISGEISNNTYNSTLKYFKLCEDELVIDSELKINLHYSDINSVFEQSDGLIINTDSLSIRTENLSNNEQVGEAVKFMKQKLSNSKESLDNSGHATNKLRKLNQLHKDGVLTDEEFESKKEELLSDF